MDHETAAGAARAASDATAATIGGKMTAAGFFGIEALEAQNATLTQQLADLAARVEALEGAA